MIIQTTVNKMVNNQGSYEKTYTTKKRSDGKIEVDFVPPKPKERPPGPKPGTGEYIDYEEIK